MIKNVYWSSCKVLVILVRLLRKLEFSRQILAILWMPLKTQCLAVHIGQAQNNLRKEVCFIHLRIYIQMYFVAWAFSQQSDQMKKYLLSQVTNLYYMFLKTGLYHIQCPISWKNCTLIIQFQNKKQKPWHYTYKTCFIFPIPTQNPLIKTYNQYNLSAGARTVVPTERVHIW